MATIESKLFFCSLFDFYMRKYTLKLALLYTAKAGK